MTCAVLLHLASSVSTVRVLPSRQPFPFINSPAFRLLGSSGWPFVPVPPGSVTTTSFCTFHRRSIAVPSRGTYYRLHGGVFVNPSQSPHTCIMPSQPAWLSLRSVLPTEDGPRPRAFCVVVVMHRFYRLLVARPVSACCTRKLHLKQEATFRTYSILHPVGKDSTNWNWKYHRCTSKYSVHATDRIPLGTF